MEGALVDKPGGHAWHLVELVLPSPSNRFALYALW